ncbi:MAG TPA: hypothetical protein VFT59_05825 [Candidatus Saccharimonadales bacterium]|nr:hypothetical protein [Candidatus Saccharimonadales bacterium]
MNRKWPWIALGIVLLAVAAVIWLQKDTKDSTNSTSSTGANQTAAPAGPPPNAGEYVRVLSGTDKNAQANLLLPGFRAANWSAEAVVPDGMALRIDQESFKASGPFGVMTGRIVESDGSLVQDFFIYLQYQDGKWLIRTFEGM